MSDSPVSDAMAEYARTNTPESFARFLALFRSTTVGFVAVGIPPNADPGGVPGIDGTSGSSSTTGDESTGDHVAGFVADGSVGAGRTTFSDGRPRLLAYADPQVAGRNFSPRFNAGMFGEVLLQMAAADPACHGILVNSATEEMSVIIDKSTAASILH